RKQAGHTSASDQCEITFKNVLLCRSYPHRPFVERVKSKVTRIDKQRNKPVVSDQICRDGFRWEMQPVTSNLD
ncbi:hypothetical protein SAMN05444358_11636, partial [Ruegeria halocynthiae]